MSAPHKVDLCQHCGHITGWHYKKRGYSEHRFQIGLVCDECNRLRSWKGGKLWTPKELVEKEGHVVSDLEWYAREDDPKPRPCMICGNPAEEFHHFGPRHAFGDDCEKWPMGHLCNPCHDLWHEKVDNHGRWKRNRRSEEPVA